MKKQPAKGKNSVKNAPKMPNGSEVVDINKTTWKIGDAIGSGGFGLIYLTEKCPFSGPVTKKASQVMKLELHDSGPLFCEQAFFQKAAKLDLVKSYLSSRKMAAIGLPNLLALGSHEHEGQRLRFLVLPRYGTDLQKLFEENGRRFHPVAVFRVAMQVMDVLEYIHTQGYAHADVKAANLMTGLKDPNEVYLIDYGLASRFSVDGKHKEYKEDPRRAHDGTVEFASRDAHKGVWPSARGDLETLGYCMWQWLAGRLPWDLDVGQKVADANQKALVAQQKTKYMGNVEGQVAPLIKDPVSSKTLCKYLSMVCKLEYDEQPKYDVVRQMFASAVTSHKCKVTDKLDFSSPRMDAPFASPVRRSGRASKVQIQAKQVPSSAAQLKSPPPKVVSAAVQRLGEAAVGKSPGRQRLFSPSPPQKKKAKVARKVAPEKKTEVAPSTPVAASALKRKREDSEEASPLKRKRMIPPKKVANEEASPSTASRPLRANGLNRGSAGRKGNRKRVMVVDDEEDDDDDDGGEKKKEDDDDDYELRVRRNPRRVVSHPSEEEEAERKSKKPKRQKPPKSSSGTQTTPGLRSRSPL